MSVTMDLSEEISPLSVTCSYYSLNTYLQTPSSQLQFRSDLPLQKRPHVRNNQFFTEIAKSSTNFESILPDENNKNGFCSSLNDLAGKDEATGDGGENDGLLQLALLKSRSGIDSQVRVSSNPEGPLSEIFSRLQNTVQEPNVVNPIEEEEVGVKTTHPCSADTVLHEFRNEIVDDELAEILCRKRRKREIRKELKFHFEDLVNKMLKKQEDMYKVLLETMEQKEKDRITREETWRNLERERMRKEEERRAQDTHRSLALLSLLEKFCGQQEINTTQYNGQQIIGIAPSPETILPDQSGQEKERLKRWPKHEIQALISLRMAMPQKMLTGATKFGMWEEISLGMASMGFTKTAKKCQEKWENINKCFKRVARSGKKRAENAKTCPYFQELDMFCKNRSHWF
ncbi:hypothetical protein MKW98_005987 [Papaver atlanticum]|uniref:Myb-like domain-containing protein n=1 Tax=Papaver atlanticum TaxID=357466 RepID=A0AAD4S6D9_9MAGN|nr:hypothetical protein MKW98_005987 [Papaver atlanticum]